MSIDAGERRLAAILAADVVGYARQLGTDEAGTLARLRRMRQHLVDPLIASHRGRIFKTMGDGLLAEFPSAVLALRCAIAIQAGLSEGAGDAPLPEGPPIRLRIGLHQGDVIVDDGDLLGDGVNVASRLEALAPPGGICISGRVYEDAAGKIALRVEDLGEQTLKHIARPMRVYRIAPSESAAGFVEGEPPLATVPRPPDRPSIAVLPFSDPAGDPEQRYYSDGITEDIITELSRFRELFVIGPNSSFACEPFAADTDRVARELGVRYVLEGSVRRADRRLRITAKLTDVRQGEQIWSDRHAGTVDDILEVQEEIAARIVASIVPEIRYAEQDRAERLPVGDVHAYDLALRAHAAISRGVAASDPALLSEGIAAAQRAIALDPSCRRAYFALAFGYCRRGAMGYFGPEARSDYDAADTAAMRLRALDRSNHLAYAILGHIAMRRLRHQEALANLRQAHQLNPNDVTTLRWLSWEESNFGLADKAREHAELSIRLSPRDRFIDFSYWVWALACYVGADHVGCIANARRAIALNRQFSGHYLLLAAGLAEAGEVREARIVANEIARMAPGLLQTRLAGTTYFVAPELNARYRLALEIAAGLRDPANLVMPGSSPTSPGASLLH